MLIEAGFFFSNIYLHALIRWWFSFILPAPLGERGKLIHLRQWGDQYWSDFTGSVILFLFSHSFSYYVMFFCWWDDTDLIRIYSVWNNMVSLRRGLNISIMTSVISVGKHICRSKNWMRIILLARAPACLHILLIRWSRSLCTARCLIIDQHRVTGWVEPFKWGVFLEAPCTGF